MRPVYLNCGKQGPLAGHLDLCAPVKFLAALLAPALLALAGCGGGMVSNNNSSNGTFSVSPGTAAIDTNCTGCNAANSAGSSVEQFTATLASGGAANVTWSVSPSTAGSITSSGQYTPPGYLTADSEQVTVTATLASNSSTKASATLTVTPGFLQPLTPENAALGSSGALTVTGYIAEAGGSTGINYTLSSSATGSGSGQGSLGVPSCVRSSSAFTYCTVSYTAPATVSSTAATYIVGTVGTSSSKASTEVLLNTAGVNSNPAMHEAQLTTPISLGSSGGNNDDYDATTSGGKTYIADCCSGTLGSLVQNSSGTQFLLSNNHVLARSDQAKVGDTIIQPGLVDDGCTPYGDGGQVTAVGTLTGWLALSSKATNADAAIAQVDSGTVNTSGNILELGAKNSNGVLAAAPPGISSTGGKGESPSLNMIVAKSGRATGLTCANVSVIDLDVQVSYYTDCAETTPYLTKTYTNQIGIEANEFSDAGDSGSLVVDTTDAEPVGLFFAGGEDTSVTPPVSEGVANPVSVVLSELDSQVGGGPYTFVGTTDHPVSCLNYGAATATAAQAHTLSDSEIARGQTAMGAARQLVSPSAGILGVATGKSSDRPGEAAVIVYVNPGMKVKTPATVDGVRTIVIPTTARAVATGSAPLVPLVGAAAPALAASVLNQAVAVKQQMAKSLMQQNPAFFGVGVGQSYDDPTQAALVIYVDRNEVPATLPATVDGLRTRYVIMPRLHVTRSYLSPIPMRSKCMSQLASRAAKFDPLGVSEPRALKLR
ncbi:MAG: hypothetical protein ACRD27_00790 [Terracidiphilus sp.]